MSSEKKRDPNNPCLFCTDAKGVSLQNELAYSARDSYAVSPGHSVVIPRRHVAEFFDLTPEEVADCMELIKKEKKLLDEEFSPDGYNVGVNVGP
ncbi:MAG: HIT family protein, partial [Gammaproteobacteria bacterium]|nr:HIT family protein [Gammaproteobacteria bacterium]